MMRRQADGLTGWSPGFSRLGRLKAGLQPGFTSSVRPYCLEHRLRRESFPHEESIS
jgi:hypothetical protein